MLNTISTSYVEFQGMNLSLSMCPGASDSVLKKRDYLTANTVDPNQTAPVQGQHCMQTLNFLGSLALVKFSQ